MESQSRIDKEGKFCGFVWFVIPKLIINIKRRAIIEAGKAKKETGKKNEGEKGGESENESEKEEERDDYEDDEDVPI